MSQRGKATGKGTVPPRVSYPTTDTRPERMSDADLKRILIEGSPLDRHIRWLEAELRQVEEACRQAMDELGVPDGNYPAPVANAYEILRAAAGTKEPR